MDIVLFFDTLGMALLQEKVRGWGKPFERIYQLTFKPKGGGIAKLELPSKTKTSLAPIKKRKGDQALPL